MMYEYGMLLQYFLVRENKFRTAAEEYGEPEFFTSAGDGEWR